MYTCDVPLEVIPVKYEFVGNEKISRVPGRTGMPVLFEETTTALLLAPAALFATPKKIRYDPELNTRYWQ